MDSQSNMFRSTSSLSKNPVVFTGLLRKNYTNTCWLYHKALKIRHELFHCSRRQCLRSLCYSTRVNVFFCSGLFTKLLLRRLSLHFGVVAIYLSFMSRYKEWLSTPKKILLFRTLGTNLTLEVIVNWHVGNRQCWEYIQRVLTPTARYLKISILFNWTS